MDQNLDEGSRSPEGRYEGSGVLAMARSGRFLCGAAGGA